MSADGDDRPLAKWDGRRRGDPPAELGGEDEALVEAKASESDMKGSSSSPSGVADEEAASDGGVRGDVVALSGDHERLRRKLRFGIMSSYASSSASVESIGGRSEPYPWWPVASLRSA